MESNMDQILNNENNIHILNTKFDKIYVIHCVEDKLRYNNIQYQIEQSGIDLNIWWTTKSHPFTEQMLKEEVINKSGKIVTIGGRYGFLSRLHSQILRDKFRKAISIEELFTSSCWD